VIIATVLLAIAAEAIIIAFRRPPQQRGAWLIAAATFAGFAGVIAVLLLFFFDWLVPYRNCRTNPRITPKRRAGGPLDRPLPKWYVVQMTSWPSGGPRCAHPFFFFLVAR
jgi:hypothetical protein